MEQQEKKFNVWIAIGLALLGIVAFVAGGSVVALVWPAVAFITPYAEKSNILFMGFTGCFAAVYCCKISKCKLTQKVACIICGSLIAIIGVMGLGIALYTRTFAIGDVYWSVCGAALILIGSLNKMDSVVNE